MWWYLEKAKRQDNFRYLKTILCNKRTPYTFVEKKKKKKKNNSLKIFSIF